MIKNKKIELSVLIVTYNVEQFIKRCISSVYKNSKKTSFEIIVVDNKSNDGTVSKIKKNFRDVKLIENKKNVGFSKALNKGFKYCQGEYVLLLNPDAFLIENSAAKLVSFLRKNKDISILGGKVYKINKKEVHRTFRKRPTFLIALFEFTNLKKILPQNRFSSDFIYSGRLPKKPLEVDAVSASFMGLRKKVVEKIGYFDKNFFLYLEDLDFCLRAKDKGYKIVYCPEAKAVHLGGGSSPNKYKINERAWRESRKYFFKKHFNFPTDLVLTFLFNIEDLILDIRHKILRG